jgi:hypothetical protein
VSDPAPSAIATTLELSLSPHAAPAPDPTAVPVKAARVTRTSPRAPNARKTDAAAASPAGARHEGCLRTSGGGPAASSWRSAGVSPAGVGQRSMRAWRPAVPVPSSPGPAAAAPVSGPGSPGRRTRLRHPHR